MKARVQFQCIWLLLLTIAATGLRSIAQNNDHNFFSKINISSPNPASLGKYGDVPVSYHTGVPNVSIPLYTIVEGSLSLPITLNYHASGLKVAETASWVGAGWSLDAGGVITRSVRSRSESLESVCPDVLLHRVRGRHFRQ